MWAGRLIRRASRKFDGSQRTADSNNREIKTLQLQRTAIPMERNWGAALRHNQANLAFAGAVRFFDAR
jgi:hypothetical protein